MSEEPNEATGGSAWRRRREGRAVSGVSGVVAERTGMPLALVRLGFVLDALLGAALALGFGVFDHALVEGGAGEGLRLSMVALGLAGLLAYPLLALILPEETSPRRWDFGSAVGAVLVLVVLGQAIGFLLGPYAHAYREGMPVAFGSKDVVLLLFFVCSACFLWLQRRAVVAFLRSMHVGVTLATLSTVAVTIGVLVPQIDGFEDPEQRVDLAREELDYRVFLDEGYQKLPSTMEDGHEQYQAFRWAEGYFLYHLFHLYGIGMPGGELAPSMEEGLERYGRRFGREAEKNRRKQMVSAMSGRDKIDEIGAFIHANEPHFWRAFEVSTTLHLNRTYKSSWFASLLVVLGLSVFASAYKGWRFRASRLPQALLGGAAFAAFAVFLRLTGALHIPWAPDMLLLVGGFLAVAAVLGPGVPGSAVSLQKLGFFVVHNGLLLLLVGGGLSKLATERGILQLDLRNTEPEDVFYRFYRSDKLGRLPFGVRLDRFARQEWLALHVDFPAEQFTSLPPRHTVWKDRRIELDYRDEPDGLRADLAIEVLEVHDEARVGLAKVKEADSPSPDPFPLAELVQVEDDGEGRHLLFPMQGSSVRFQGEVLADPGGAWRLGASYGSDPASHFPEPGDPAHPRVGLMQVQVVGEGDGQPRLVSVELGRTIELDGGYRIEVRQATSDFRVGEDTEDESRHPLPLERQPGGLAALWVDVIPPDRQAERRVVYEGIDDLEHGRQADFLHREVVLRFLLDRWTMPGPPRYLLAWGGDGQPELIGEDGSRRPVTPGEVLPLPGVGPVVARQLLDDADFETNLDFVDHQPDATGFDPAFYSPAPRGVRLRITRGLGTPDERSEVVDLATQVESASVWFSDDHQVLVRLVENSEMLPFEWRSVLSILERDNAGNWYEVPLGSERRREIRVNDYLYYQGYRLFQTNADARVPTYSGIGVVYDPGIPLVLYGMYVVIAGGAIAFLLRPVVRGWGKVPGIKRQA